MKKTLLISFFLLSLVGCSSELSYSEIKLEDTPESVHTFFESVEETNGTHHYTDGEKTYYVMLNGKNVFQGEKAIHFRNFRVDSEAEILKIHFTEEETDDYSNETVNYPPLKFL
ncbi:hypothetical protein CR203_18990 [Salipaludibacillus neizhouensis]|uniref:Uncharacterized protein n=1 Tax=Salipaludibacillus neizhouensis TaxID=885475 RepID=A0A3A9KLP6_9BACI|nr:hypothetical protein [Salipaludibacillus neizhouensis]RKL65736.1 hypothetical protein CR203_18990 [Salipaludibacillus neizhouensis]